MSDNNFEQDRSYHDMDGNLRNFSIRDYSNAGRNRLKVLPSTDEQKEEATFTYHKGLRETVEDLCQSAPAIFARDVDEAIEIIDGKIEWNKQALFIALKDWMNVAHYNNIWSRVNRALFTNIKELINCKELDCRDKVNQWKDHFRKTQTL